MLWIRSWVDGRWEPIFLSFVAMALASKGPIQMGSPVLFDRSINRTTNPFEVESNVNNFTFISTYILSLLSFSQRQRNLVGRPILRSHGRAQSPTPRAMCK